MLPAGKANKQIQQQRSVPRRHLAAESLANSNEFTSAGSPRKWRRGLGHKGSNNCQCFPLSKDKSGTILLAYLLLRVILVFEVSRYSVAQGAFWLCICLL